MEEQKYYVVDESQPEDEQVVEENLTLRQAEDLLCDLCNGGGDPYIMIHAS